MKRGVVVALAVLVGMLLAQRRQQRELETCAPTGSFLASDTTDKNWDGTIDVETGEVVSISGWRFGEGDSVDGVKGWKLTMRIGPRGSARGAGRGGEVGRPAVKPLPAGSHSEYSASHRNRIPQNSLSKQYCG